MLAIKEMIVNEIDRLPENYLVEVFDFIKFLEVKRERSTLLKASQQLSATSIIILKRLLLLRLF